MLASKTSEGVGMAEDEREFYASATGEQTPQYDGDELEAPILAIPNGQAARTVYYRLRESHSRRAYIYARIQGMIDGNPPYSKKEMKRSGLQTHSNVNWRDGEAIYESVVLAYWSLFNEVDYIARIDTTISDPSNNPNIGDILSRNWDKMVRGWDKFSSLMSQHQGDLIKFGLSFIFWPDKDDWRFDIGDPWQTLLPERSRSHVDFLSVVAIEQTMTAQELWIIYKNKKVDKWNKDVLARILFYVSSLYTDTDYNSGDAYMEFQHRIRNQDTLLDELYNKDVSMVSLFIKEYDGKISRGMIHEDLDGGTGFEYVFFAEREYDSMEEVLQLFTFAPGEKYLHGNKGIGHRIYNIVEGTTQLDNSVMDAARRSGTVLVRSRTGRNKNPKKVLFNFGGLTDIGEAEFVQNLMGANIAPLVDVSRYFQFKVESNSNISGSLMRTPDGKPRTLGEVQAQATREARVQKHKIAHYYHQLDTLFEHLLKRQLDNQKDSAVEEWKQRCIEEGVPEEFFDMGDVGEDGLPEHLSIKATRASGSGSQVADQIEMQQVMQILPTLGERGRENALEDYVAAYRGHSYVSRYFPIEDQMQQPVGADTIASIENNQLEKGEMVVVSPDNNHAVHAPAHLKRLQQIAEAFNQAESQARQTGADNPQVEAGNFGQYSLEDVDIAFQTLGPHFVRHLLFLQQDPTRASLAQSLGNQWAILANFGDKIANNAQEHRSRQLRDLRKQEEEMDNLDMEERVKMREVEVDAQIKMAKLRADIERGATRDQLQYLLQRQKVSFEAQIKREKAAVEVAEKARSQATATEQTTGKAPTELF